MLMLTTGNLTLFPLLNCIFSFFFILIDHLVFYYFFLMGWRYCEHQLPNSEVKRKKKDRSQFKGFSPFPENRRELFFRPSQVLINFHSFVIFFCSILNVIHFYSLYF